MLLTIRTTQQPAADLGFLLHKHPDHVHTREFPFGNATVFYPEATEDGCTAAIVIDVDPVGMVRGRGGKGGGEDQYVNDRPYVVSSLLSVVLSRWFNSALGGRCERKPELSAMPLPLEARIPLLHSATAHPRVNPFTILAKGTLHERDDEQIGGPLLQLLRERT